MKSALSGPRKHFKIPSTLTDIEIKVHFAPQAKQFGQHQKYIHPQIIYNTQTEKHGHNKEANVDKTLAGLTQSFGRM
jgi:D-alanyl-D-alanine dipeptidase